MAPDEIGGRERAGRRSTNARRREGCFLPGGLQDLLHPGTAFSHASPAVKLWSDKQVSCLCYYLIKDVNSGLAVFLPCLYIFMSLWCPPAAVDSREELLSGHAAGAWSHERERAVISSARFPSSSYVLITGGFESQCRRAMGLL